MNSHPHLVHVDPDDDVRATVAAAFDGERYGLTSVASAEAALDVLGDGGVDCVVSEYALGDGAVENGLALFDRLSDVPFVLFTDAGDESLAGRAVAAGVDGYVPRHDGVETLRERVDALMDGPMGADDPESADEPESTDEPEWSEYLVEQSPLAVIEWTLDNEIKGWNSAAEDLFGYGEREAIGADGDDLIGVEGAKESVEAVERRLRTGERRIHNVNRNVRADGSEITCEWYNSPIFEDGEVSGVVSFVRDVTDRVRRTRALEALQETSRDLMHAESRAEIASVIADAVDTVLGRDRAVVRLYDEETEMLRVSAATDAVIEAGSLLPPVDERDEGEPIWDVYATQEPLVIEHVTGENFPRGAETLGSILSYPLGEHGALTFGSAEHAAFDEVDEHLVAVLAATAEAALDRAAREEDLVGVEHELRERSETIETLHEVVAELDRLDAEADIWETCVAAAEGVLNFDECGVDTVIDDEFVMMATSSEVVPNGYSERAPASEGIAGQTYRTGETYRYDDVTEVLAASPQHRSYRSMLSVPVGDEGVFQAVSAEVGAFDEKDAELAELLMAHVSDALDRVAYESDLRNERDRFAALFENVPDAVVQTRPDPDGGPIVESVNPAFERRFGYDAAEIVGTDLHEFVVPPDRLDEAEEIDEYARNGEVVEREVRRRTADGLRDFLVTVVPVDRDAVDRSTFAVYTDITERKQREKRVEVLNRVLRHDLRNGMNIIKGCAEMLETVVDAPDRQYAEIIEERADDLIGLAEKTRSVERTLGRQDTGGPVDVVDCVERAVAGLEPEYPDATFAVDAPETAEVQADDLLEAAVFHVVENACLHNDGDAPRVEIRVADASGRDDGIEVTIADDGPGIPTEERELLTEEREITQLRHASGLGLWLVNWVVTQAGGDLAFEENEPRGTVVRLSLPTVRTELFAGGG